MKTTFSSARFLSLIFIPCVCFLSHARAQSLIQTLTSPSLIQTLLGSSAAPQGPQDIYLAVRHDGIPGTGTASDPFDASTEDKYDQLLATYSANTTFHYAPGTYQTLGWYNGVRQTAGANCKHYGAGIDQTIIQLVGANSTTFDGVIFGSDYYVTADGFEIHTEQRCNRGRLLKSMDCDS